MGEKFRAKMPIAQRAKQFSPFAALRGFEDALYLKEKPFSEKPEFSEEMFDELNSAFFKAEKNKKITVTYYSDGEFIDYTGIVTKKDFFNRTITIDKNIFLLDDILDITLL